MPPIELCFNFALSRLPGGLPAEDEDVRALAREAERFVRVFLDELSAASRRNGAEIVDPFDRGGERV